MSFRALVVGAAAVLWSVPVVAQQRGTVEFEAFGSLGRFDRDLSLIKGYGVGGHVGVFLHPRFAFEFEKGEMRASRPSGLKDVNVGILSGRAVGSLIRNGPLTVMVGAGAGGSTETNFLHSYGVNALLGAKIALGDRMALRVDGISDWLANNDWKSYQRVQMGLSLFRQPHRMTQTVRVEVPVPGPAMVQRPDSVSADEQARLRRLERDYLALRDSLRTAPPPAPPVQAPIKTEKDRRVP